MENFIFCAVKAVQNNHSSYFDQLLTVANWKSWRFTEIRLFSMYTNMQVKIQFIFNPNKAGLFESSFFRGEGQFDPPFIFQEVLT